MEDVLSAAGLNTQTVPPFSCSLPHIDICNSNRETHSRIAAVTKTVYSHSLPAEDHLELLARLSKELVELQLPLDWRDDVISLLQQSLALRGEHLWVDTKHHRDVKLFAEHLTDTVAKLSISLTTLYWHPSLREGNNLENLLPVLSGIVASLQQKQSGLYGVRAGVVDLAELSSLKEREGFGRPSYYNNTTRESLFRMASCVGLI